jgi:hypothetical protein
MSFVEPPQHPRSQIVRRQLHFSLGLLGFAVIDVDQIRLACRDSQGNFIGC